MSSGMFMCQKCKHVNKYDEGFAIGLGSVFVGLLTMGLSLIIQIVNAAFSSSYSDGGGGGSGKISRPCQKCGTMN